MNHLPVLFDFDEIVGAKPTPRPAKAGRKYSREQFMTGVVAPASGFADQARQHTVVDEIVEATVQSTGLGAWDYRTHNGAVTMFNPATGEHRTLVIRTQPDDSNFAPGERILSLKTGPEYWENTSFAFVKSDRIIVWKKYRGTKFDVLARMLENPAAFQARGVEYLAEGKCRICNRPLTHPDSIKLGIGPICAENL